MSQLDIARAVKEAGAFLEAFDAEGSGRDAVDVQCTGIWGYPPLTVGTVRALYALALAAMPDWRPSA